MVDLFNSGTEYLACQITLLRGVIADITDVGVYLTTNPNDIPDPDPTGATLGDFVEVLLVDGTGTPPLPALAEEDKIDIVFKVGPRGGDFGDPTPLTAGDYQVYVLIRTASEDIIRRPSTITII
jgi:hypothetical protein